MARRPTKSQRRQFAALIAKLEPQVRAAFEASAADLRAGVDFAALLEALRENRIEAAIAALNIDESAFYAFGTAKTAAYSAGGALTASTVSLGPDSSIVFRFDMRNPRAEAWVRNYVGGRITAFTQEQLQVARAVMLEGYGMGRGPLDIGRDLAGRVINGTRQGGVIGLDAERARRLLEVSRGMETAEGVQDLVQGGRVRYAVNPATRARILKAAKAGTAVPVKERAVSIAQYQNLLLKSRGETIARTETAQAVRSAQREEWQQVMDKQGIPPEAIIKTWIHGGGVKDPRPHHVAANGMTVQGIDTPFQLNNGAVLQYPHDPNASGAETINCTCSCEIRLDPSYGADE